MVFNHEVLLCRSSVTYAKMHRSLHRESQQKGLLTLLISTGGKVGVISLPLYCQATSLVAVKLDLDKVDSQLRAMLSLEPRSRMNGNITNIQLIELKKKWPH